MTLRSDVGPFSIIPRWLLDADVSHAAIKLYAILADYADRETGEATPGRKLLAKRLGQKAPASVDTVDRAKNELLDLGALRVVARFEDGVQRSNVYVLVMADPGRTDAAPSPQGSGPGSRTDAAQNKNQGNQKKNTPPRGPVAEVGKRKVTEEEHELAAAILDAFNARFETDYRGADHYKGVVGRIRERPDLTLARHVELIEKMGRQTWWRRGKRGEELLHPSPRHLYGTGKALDFVVNAPEEITAPADDLFAGYTKA